MNKTFFIIPYRDRENDKIKFISHMNTYLKKIDFKEEYTFLFSHQCDKRPFNRGAIKNIGFISVKNKYPNDYKNFTFVFHDIDTLPSYDIILPYTTTHGTLKHYYGYKFALGGIFVIKGNDFELTKGFPNFWGWGFEDNTMYERCISSKINVDRSIFFDIKDKNILNSNNDIYRIISKRDANVYKYESPDNIESIKNLKYIIEYCNNNENVCYSNITDFSVEMEHSQQIYEKYDIRKGNKFIIPKGYFRKTWKLF